MIQRLQKISAQLFKNALKTYTSSQVLTHRKKTKNAIQMLAVYPNKGQGFIVRKKHWPEGLYYSIKRAQYKSIRNGHLYGIKYSIKDGQKILEDSRPVRLHGMNKRGIWTYEIGDFQKYETDNNLVYNRADYQAFLKVKGIGIPKQNKSKNQQAQAGQQQQNKGQQQSK